MKASVLVIASTLSIIAAACGGTTATPPRPTPAPNVAPAPSATAAPVELLPQPTTGFPPGIAPESARVDVAKPTFLNPTTINNPLLPITEVDQLIQLGLKDGLPHRTEFTLLPGTRSISWYGEQTEVRVLQFVAYLDGRVLEHALDFLAQADGGAVWYFGEDVYNYENGVVADRDGTWLAGTDGPPAMIMPAQPQVGNVYRVENIPGNVFEEVMVLAIDQTLEGPRGLIRGVMFVQQIGLDGKTSLKAFAPGYGEFLAHTEDVAVAVPIDALSAPLPVELTTVLTGANRIFDAASSGDWDAHTATLATMTSAWESHQTNVDWAVCFPCSISKCRAHSSRSRAPSICVSPTSCATAPSTWPWPLSTCSCPTGLWLRSTWTASTCGRGGRLRTVPPPTRGTWRATSPSWNSSGNGSATPSRRLPPMRSSLSSVPCAPPPMPRISRPRRVPRRSFGAC